MVSYVNRGIQAAALTRTQFLNIVASSITAFAGGGKGSATPTTTANVRIGTVATAADSVLIPSPRAGDVMLLSNAGANAAQIFAAGTATIDGVATGTGISLPAGSVILLIASAAGVWRSILLASNAVSNADGGTVTANRLKIGAETLTAFAGGGKASATPVTKSNVNIGTVATAADSILLPTPVVGDTLLVMNNGANAAQLFGAGTSTINGAATGTGVSLAATKLAFVTCYTAGAWILTALN